MESLVRHIYYTGLFKLFIDSIWNIHVGGFWQESEIPGTLKTEKY